MALFNALLANSLTMVAGALLVLWALGRPLVGHAAGYALGAGYLLGVGLVALTGWLCAMVGWGDSPIPAALVLLCLAVVSGWMLLLQAPAARPVAAGARQKTPVWWWLLLAVMLINAVLLAHEALTRAIYPWDAWSAWSVKARVWIEMGSAVDFVPFAQWLAAENPLLYTNEAWQYPELLPRYQLWVLQWIGGWDDAPALLPWLFAGASLLLMLYHGLRLLDVSAPMAMAVTFVVATIPILNVQLALPGLADLWIAAELTLFVTLTLLWTERRQWRWLGLIALALAMVASTKLEGIVWAVLCLPVVFFCTQHKLLRRVGAGLLAAAAALWWIARGFELTLGNGMQLVLTPDRISMPYLGQYDLAFSNQFASFFRSFLILPNWHLIWYLLPAAVVVAVVGQIRTPQGRGLLTLAVISSGFMFVLFFLTHAGMWAESMTASNRLALHYVPALVLWTGLLLYRMVAGAPTKILQQAAPTVQ